MRILKGLIAGTLLLLTTASCSGDKETNTIVDKPATEKSFTPEEKAKIERLDTLFNSLFNRNEFIGNVLIAQKGKMLYMKSFGMADLKTKTNNTDSTIFQLASVSKTFTACLILQLVDSGKIDLKADVKTYLPDFPYENINIEHLLTHRSGLFNYIYFCSGLGLDPATKLDGKRVYELICEHKPAPYLNPGQKFNYCNTNYMLLPLIAEKATGKAFKELIREYIINKCGMVNTCFAAEHCTNQNSAKGYTFSMREVEEDMFDGVLGDKGIFTTTYDLFLFEEAYFNGKLFSSKLLDAAQQPYSRERKLGNYGYGWRMKNFNDSEKIIYHNGWWHGFRTALQRRVKDSTDVIILSNRLNGSVYQTWRVFNTLDGIQVQNGNDSEGED